MKRILMIAGLVLASVGLTGCLASFDLKDDGRYTQYTNTALGLAIAAQETEKARIQALGEIAKNADARTQDRVVSELAVRTSPAAQSPVAIQAPQAPTNMLLETMRILGPGSLGLVSQGIAAWNQNQADILATQRALSQQQSVQGIITEALNANTGLGLRGMDLAGQAVDKLPVMPPSVRVELPAAPTE
jgi:hypothetical protein